MALSSASTRTFKPLRVFVVENHPDTLACVRLCLERLGHTVCCADGVSQALQVLPGANCDVLLCDLGLSDGDGFELLRHAQEQLAGPFYAVAMSGRGTNHDHQASKAAGFQHHLNKPFAPKQLAAVLADAVQWLPASTGA